MIYNQNISLIISMIYLSIFTADVFAISGGKKVESNSTYYKWQVGIFYQGKFKASGVIVGNKLIVSTAANFRTVGENIEDLCIALGQETIQHSQCLFFITELIIHEDYDPCLQFNDISILKLSKPLQEIIPIKIHNVDINPNTKVIITGWGLHFFGQRYLPAEYRLMETTTLKIPDCRNIYRKTIYTKLDHKSICTRTNNIEGTCIGDSGDPVIFQDSLVGLVSGGGMCNSGKPNVNVRVYEYIAWILKQCLR